MNTATIAYWKSRAERMQAERDDVRRLLIDVLRDLQSSIPGCYRIESVKRAGLAPANWTIDVPSPALPETDRAPRSQPPGTAVIRAMYPPK